MKSIPRGPEAAQRTERRAPPGIGASRGARPHLDPEIIRNALKNHRDRGFLPHCFRGRGNATIMVVTTRDRRTTFFFLPEEWNRYAERNGCRKLTPEESAAA